LIGEPGHSNGSSHQDTDSYQAAPGLATADTVQNRSQHDKSRQREEQSSGHASGACFIEMEPKNAKDNGC
jgi:hypothetical protein